eukprot:TRINITY_DN5249_c0_g1_i1.p1 TRINITY_DN5249_c0_g1~~TRINITY_DN5249_c0_g1_i1.p1  ORF type:complete len:523 (+),score=63.76 TRINITY_DN5249_c0_g1_i1:236-1804(+)
MAPSGKQSVISAGVLRWGAKPLVKAWRKGSLIRRCQLCGLVLFLPVVVWSLILGLGPSIGLFARDVMDQVLNAIFGPYPLDDPLFQTSTFFGQRHKSDHPELPCSLQPIVGEYPGHANSYDSNGYLMVSVMGGINQQRKGIVNAVLLAYVLNATLVVPTLEQHKYWQQAMHFRELYDEQHFIDTVKEDIKIVRELPTSLSEKLTRILQLDRVLKWHVNATSNVTSIRGFDEAMLMNAEQMVDKFLPILKAEGVLQVTGWHVQPLEILAPHLQRVRCRANFHAIKFVPEIQRVAKLVLDLLRRGGPAFTLHLRFESDWVDHYGCRFNSKTLLTENYRVGLHHHDHCLLTPGEIALVLKAVGVSSNTTIFLAGSDVHQSSVSMPPFRKLFPKATRRGPLLRRLMENKEHNIDRKFVLEMGWAIDHIVCAESDIMVAADGESNWAHVVTGERFYYRNPNKETLLISVEDIKPLVERKRVRLVDVRRKMQELRLDFIRRGCLHEKGLSFCSPLDCLCPAPDEEDDL